MNNPPQWKWGKSTLECTSFLGDVAGPSGRSHAQVKPNEVPPRVHYLLELYDELDPVIKTEAQQLLCELSPLGEQEWIGENPRIRDLIQQGNSNFSDWRYPQEKATISGGVPKVMVNVVQIIQKLCLQYVLASSA